MTDGPNWRVRWRVLHCDMCDGLGTRLDPDHAGADPCAYCDGTGTLYVSPRDRLTVYPGKPFRGVWPGAWQDAMPITLGWDDWRPESAGREG